MTPAAKKPSEVLSAAADLIEPEGAWTRGALGRTSEGSALGYGSVLTGGAVCWCALGALVSLGDSNPARDYLYQTLGQDEGVADFNDHPDRTQAEVVAALRQAAELARSEGQ